LKTAIRVSRQLGQPPVAALESADRVLPAVKEPNMYATLALLLRGVNYFCRSTTTISAGEGLAKERRWRPQRNSVIVAGWSRARSDTSLVILFELRKR
jgi:hypothetical protein